MRVDFRTVFTEVPEVTEENSVNFRDFRLKLLNIISLLTLSNYDDRLPLSGKRVGRKPTRGREDASHGKDSQGNDTQCLG